MLENLKELAKFRALIGALVSRHLSMRYRGSLLGFLWSFLNPLCLMLVYTLVFRYYIRFTSIENYTIFVFCGLLPWIWISSGLMEGTSSIVSSGHLITKSMFPAHVLPLVAALTSMINFLLSLPLLFLFMYAAGIPFHATLILVPVCVLLQLIFIYGLSLAFGSINVQFRDVQHILGNFLTFLFFLCPVVYSATTVPEAFRFTLEINPFASLLMMYHSLIMDGVLPSVSTFAYVGAWALLSLLIGNMLYNRYRDGFAELL